MTTTPANPRRFSDTMSNNRPRSAFTKPAVYLMFFLNLRKVDMKGEVPVERPLDDDGLPQAPYWIDCLVLPDVAVEVNGGVHEKPKQFLKDLKKIEYLKSKGYKVIVFTNEEAWQDPQGCIEKILKLRDST